MPAEHPEGAQVPANEPTQTSPEARLLGYLRGTSALAGQLLDHAIVMQLHPAVLQRLANANRALTEAALSLMTPP